MAIIELFINLIILSFMLKHYFLITKLNLMKKTVFRIDFLLCFVVFFFVGIATTNAQYVSNDEAIIILKAETTDLEAQIPGSTDLEVLDLQFRITYFKSVGWDITDGTEVGAAILNNQPTGKGKLYPNGVVTALNDDPNLKQEILDLVAYTDALLSD